jgi:hypothetical protein
MELAAIALAAILLVAGIAYLVTRKSTAVGGAAPGPTTPAESPPQGTNTNPPNAPSS